MEALTEIISDFFNSIDPNRFIRVAPQGLQIALIPPDGGSLIRYPAIRSYLTAGGPNAIGSSQKARVHIASRRHSAGVAARGAGAASEDAGDRIFQRSITGLRYGAPGGATPEPERSRLRRKRKHRDRIPLGRGPGRAIFRYRGCRPPRHLGASAS